MNKPKLSQRTIKRRLEAGESLDKPAMTKSQAGKLGKKKSPWSRYPMV